MDSKMLMSGRPLTSSQQSLVRTNPVVRLPSSRHTLSKRSTFAFAVSRRGPRKALYAGGLYPGPKLEIALIMSFHSSHLCQHEHACLNRTNMHMSQHTGQAVFTGSLHTSGIPDCVERDSVHVEPLGYSCIDLTFVKPLKYLCCARLATRVGARKAKASAWLLPFEAGFSSSAAMIASFASVLMLGQAATPNPGRPKRCALSLVAHPVIIFLQAMHSHFLAPPVTLMAPSARLKCFLTSPATLASITMHV